jgi:hypothetical protein
MSSSKKSSSKGSKGSMSPKSPMSAPNTSALLLSSLNQDMPEFVVPSPMARPGSVVVESVEGPMVVASAAAAPNTANLLRFREPVRVNISPRARWSSSSEGRGRRRRTKKFPVARMRDRPPTPRATRIYPRLRRPPVVPARVRDWVARDRAWARMDLSPISPSSADIRRYMEDQSLWGDSSSFSSPPLSPATRYGHLSRSRSPRSRSPRSRSPRSHRRLMVRINREGRATRYGVPRIAPPPAGRPRTLRRNRQLWFRDDNDDRRHRREWRKTRKQLKRKFGIRFPKGSSSSSSSSSASSSRSRSRSRSIHSDDAPPPPGHEGVQSGGRLLV